MADIIISIQVLQVYTYINHAIEIQKTGGKQTFGEAINGHIYYKDIDNVKLFHKDSIANLVKPHINLFSAMVKFKVV